MSTGDILFIVAVVAIIAALVIWVATIAARAKRMSAASDAVLAVKLEELASAPPTPGALDRRESDDRFEPVMTASAGDGIPDSVVSSTKEGRLAELAELHSRGLISADELAAARAKILAE